MNQLGLDCENFSIIAYSKQWIQNVGYVFGVGPNTATAYILVRFNAND
jgi:hypothetical protein